MIPVCSVNYNVNRCRFIKDKHGFGEHEAGTRNIKTVPPPSTGVVGLIAEEQEERRGRRRVVSALIVFTSSEFWLDIAEEGGVYYRLSSRSIFVSCLSWR